MQLKVRIRCGSYACRIFPLANVYTQLPSSSQYSSPVASGLYGSQYYGQYPGMTVHPMLQMSRPYGKGRVPGGRQWRARGYACFC